jgi:protein involved in polysaccharide export with SLBB domain
VYVEGDVAHPGRYPFAANMRASDLVRAAGGALRSASPENGKLDRYVAANGKSNETTTVATPVNVASALEGAKDADTLLKPGDVLTIPQRNGWKDIGASVAVRGEVKRPGTYGIRPGERLSAVLKLAGGFNGEAYPYAAVLTRPEVRDVQMKQHIELVQRVQMEQLALKGLPENDPDQKNAKLTAVAQAQTALQQLESIAPIGRVVIHVTPNIKEWENTGNDPVVQDGDVLVIPKRPNYVTVAGQVFNPTAINYRPGRSAKWYLQQAGGMTQLASKQASFVVRADGSVVAAKNNSGWWSGDPMGAVLRPGDSIVVPERAAKIGGRNWTPVLQMAQIAASVGIAAAYTLK